MFKLYFRSSILPSKLVKMYEIMSQLYTLSHVLSSTDMQIPRFSVICELILHAYVMGRARLGNGNVSFVLSPRNIYDHFATPMRINAHTEDSEDISYE